MNDGDFVAGCIFGMILGILIGWFLIGDSLKYDSHVALGSKGHACFANHTCRENLKCLVADGIDETCVKP